MAPVQLPKNLLPRLIALSIRKRQRRGRMRSRTAMTRTCCKRFPSRVDRIFRYGTNNVLIIQTRHYAGLVRCGSLAAADRLSAVHRLF